MPGEKDMGDRDTCATWAVIHISHVKEEFHVRHLTRVKHRTCGKGWSDALLCSLGSLHNLISILFLGLFVFFFGLLIFFFYRQGSSV